MLAPVNLTVLLAALVIGFAAETSEARPAPSGRVAIPIRRLAGHAESSLNPAIVSRHLPFVLAKVSVSIFAGHCTTRQSCT